MIDRKEPQPEKDPTILHPDAPTADRAAKSGTASRWLPAALAAGLALNVFSLMVSFGVLSVTYEPHGVPRPDPATFLVTGCCSLALLLFIPVIRKKGARQAFLLLSLVGCITWTVLGCTLASDRALFPASGPLSTLYTVLGCFSSITLSVIWGWCIFKQEPFMLLKIVVAATFITLGLCLVGGTFDDSFLSPPAAALASLALAFAVSMSNGVSPWSKGADDHNEKRPALRPPIQSVPLARRLFVATRVAWGVALGLYMGAPLAPPGLVQYSTTVALAALVVLAAATGFVALSPPTRSSSLYLVAAAPVVSLAVLFTVVDPDSPILIARLFIVAGMLLWCLSLMIQYPMCSAVTDLSPYPFVAIERIVSLSCACLVAATETLVLSGSTPLATPSSGVLGFAFLAVVAFLLVVSVALLLTHVHRYYPFSANRLPDLLAPQKAMDLLRSAFDLTPRESEVCFHLAAGFSKAYIAQLLCVSPLTIKTHTQNIYRKLSVGSSDELIERVKATLNVR